MVDASVLIASLERDVSTHLERLHEKAAFISPPLLIYESGNVIHRKKPSSFAASADARAELLSTLLSDVEIVGFDPDSPSRIGKLAEAERLSFYDATYLELAIQRDAALLTEDDQLAKAASRRLKSGRVLRLPAP